MLASDTFSSIILVPLKTDVYIHFASIEEWCGYVTANMSLKKETQPQIYLL